jgi:hypothetical protein
MDYQPYAPQTKRFLHDLATLQPKTLAAMHGSTFVGDGAQALRAVYGQDASDVGPD